MATFNSGSETPNPLKLFRERLGKTLEETAALAEVSKHFVIRSEQGVYTEPPETLVDFYKEYFDFDDIKADYYRYQRNTRIANYGKLLEPWNFNAPVGKHPFIHWRQLSGMHSQAGVCKYFCVHPAVVSKFEKGLGNIPEQLLAALLESGYSVDTLNLLEKAYLAFKSGKVLEVVNDSN